MNTKNLERYLESFGKYVVKQARTNLTKGKKNVSKELYNSISFEVETESNGDFTVQFMMDYYGKFVDKGVSGNKKKRTYKDWQGKTVSTPYKYTTKQPPSSVLTKWIKMRGIKGRDSKTGRFITNKTLAFLIGRSIKTKGIQGISFFQRPLQLAMQSFPKEFGAELKQDIIETLNNK
tara:strand:+ start:178 stop:708 length:531 start_codon:yes stop_codon:yes gene_type:complete